MRLTRRIALPTGLEICLSMRPAPAARPRDGQEAAENATVTGAEDTNAAIAPPAERV